eukprot:TRINITY_DN29231_c0_g1_i1.p4 TRINITY_DN29231_c0_g1~~TRINITY_DN29231_c0_g1_i1.p4  ORF type:complete len:169 (-),score=23.37 TRINITY_DN29231_c0_g1_i1:866-1372(-)
MDFLIKNKEKVKIIKEEEIKSSTYEDVFSKLRTSRIYFEKNNNGMVDILILDFDRGKTWIYKALLEKIEPIFKTLNIYNGYNIKILTLNDNREKRLKKDINKMDHRGLIFLKSIEIINLNIETFFQSTIQKESFLKDIDKLEIAKLQEKLKNNQREQLNGQQRKQQTS